MDFEQGEVLLVNKPLHWTSFDVVNKIRYALRKKTGNKVKVGHAGTLDPLATGLLIICTGKMTRKIDEYTGMDKAYTGTFLMGATTPSFDAETAVDNTYPTGHITEAMLNECAAGFIGEMEQVPPVYSAIKIEGKAAYLHARKGKEVEMKARKATIRQFELTRTALPEVDFRVVCTKGTYIRSLANDFGKVLHSGAYLKALCRTAIGDFKLKDAWEIEALVNTIFE
ncbi:MAG TPA: tRNA pseudouridine(55) synthase TruB [Chitinophagales bacterium]|nr:tRNA pseudouridine(55) synthase TruB [Chitinophagales bacterium]